MYFIFMYIKNVLYIFIYIKDVLYIFIYIKDVLYIYVYKRCTIYIYTPLVPKELTTRRGYRSKHNLSSNVCV